MLSLASPRLFGADGRHIRSKQARLDVKRLTIFLAENSATSHIKENVNLRGS